MLGTRVLEALLRKASSSETRAILVDTVAATRNTTTELQFAHVTDDSSLFTRGKYLIPVIRGDVGSPEVADALKRFVAEDWAGPQTSNNAAVGGALPVGRLLSSSPRLKVSVFHLASVMSAQAERNFAQAFRINVDGERACASWCMFPVAYIAPTSRQRSRIFTYTFVHKSRVGTADLTRRMKTSNTCDTCWLISF